MTTDRDRLAADLAHSMAHPDDIGIVTAFHHRVADRLLALGWTRRAESVRDAAERLGIPITDHGLPPDVVRPAAFAADYDRTLDEERLARALRAARGDAGDPDGEDYESAAAIAKAYREDTDAHD